MQAAFLDFDTLGPADLDVAGLRAVLPGIHFFAHTAPEELAARLAEHEVVILNKVRLDRRLLAGTPRLRLVCLAATGTDQADLAAARVRYRGHNVRDYGGPSVAQHVRLILSLTLHLPDTALVRRLGAEQPVLPPILHPRAGRKTLGIVATAISARRRHGRPRWHGGGVAALRRRGRLIDRQRRNGCRRAPAAARAAGGIPRVAALPADPGNARADRPAGAAAEQPAHHRPRGGPVDSAARAGAPRRLDRGRRHRRVGRGTAGARRPAARCRARLSSRPTSRGQRASRGSACSTRSRPTFVTTWPGASATGWPGRGRKLSDCRPDDVEIPRATAGDCKHARTQQRGAGR